MHYFHFEGYGQLYRKRRGACVSKRMNVRCVCHSQLLQMTWRYIKGSIFLRYGEVLNYAIEVVSAEIEKKTSENKKECSLRLSGICFQGLEKTGSPFQRPQKSFHYECSS